MPGRLLNERCQRTESHRLFELGFIQATHRQTQTGVTLQYVARVEAFNLKEVFMTVRLKEILTEHQGRQQ